MFTDNDELSGMIASMLDVQALIILSNIDGIYNGSPSQPGTSVIREVEQGKICPTTFRQKSRALAEEACLPKQLLPAR